ncbi:MAG: hypothetical protein ACP5P3_05105 [Ignavibacteria bacterium]
MENRTQIFLLKKENLNLIEKFFGSAFEEGELSVSVKIRNNKTNSFISLDIHFDENDSLVSVYTEVSHLQLQLCKGFFISDVLEEITFFSEDENTISALIVSRQGDCSLYSNVEKKLLKEDLLKLNAEKLLSVAALSLLESLSE